jgi:hypothetical protein
MLKRILRKLLLQPLALFSVLGFKLIDNIINSRKNNNSKDEIDYNTLEKFSCKDFIANLKFILEEDEDVRLNNTNESEVANLNNTNLIKRKLSMIDPVLKEYCKVKALPPLPSNITQDKIYGVTDIVNSPSASSSSLSLPKIDKEYMENLVDDLKLYLNNFESFMNSNPLASTEDLFTEYSNNTHKDENNLTVKEINTCLNLPIFGSIGNFNLIKLVLSIFIFYLKLYPIINIYPIIDFGLNLDYKIYYSLCLYIELLFYSLLVISNKINNSLSNNIKDKLANRSNKSNNDNLNSTSLDKVSFNYKISKIFIVVYFLLCIRKFILIIILFKLLNILDISVWNYIEGLLTTFKLNYNNIDFTNIELMTSSSLLPFKFISKILGKGKGKEKIDNIDENSSQNSDNSLPYSMYDDDNEITYQYAHKYKIKEFANTENGKKTILRYLNEHNVTNRKFNYENTEEWQEDLGNLNFLKKTGLYSQNKRKLNGEFNLSCNNGEGSDLDSFYFLKVGIDLSDSNKLDLIKLAGSDARNKRKFKSNYSQSNEEKPLPDLPCDDSTDLDNFISEILPIENIGPSTKNNNIYSSVRDSFIDRLVKNSKGKNTGFILSEEEIYDEVMENIIPEELIRANDNNKRDTIDSLISKIQKNTSSFSFSFSFSVSFSVSLSLSLSVSISEDSSLCDSSSLSESIKTNESEYLYYDSKLIKDLATKLKERNQNLFIPILFSIKKINIKKFIVFILILVVRGIYPLIMGDFSLLLSVNLTTLSEPLIIDMSIEEYEDWYYNLGVYKALPELPDMLLSYEELKIWWN